MLGDAGRAGEYEAQIAEQWRDRESSMGPHSFWPLDAFRGPDCRTLLRERDARVWADG